MATKKETALTKTAEATDTKALMAEQLDDAFAEFLSQEGVALVSTVTVGDPSQPGKLPGYIGELIGPGRGIDIVNEKNGEVTTLPTWALHPFLNGAVQRNVTNVIPSPHQLNADFGRIHDRCKAEGLTALVGVRYLGQVKNRRGLPVNNYQVFEKFSKA